MSRANAPRPPSDGAARFRRPGRLERQGTLNPNAVRAAEQLRREVTAPAILSGLLLILEFSLLWWSGVMVEALFSGTTSVWTWHYPVLFAISSLLIILLFNFGGGYAIAALAYPLPTLRRLMPAPLVIFVLAWLAGRLLGFFDWSSYLLCNLWLVVGLMAVGLLRLAVARPVRRWARNGLMERRVVIVGGGAQAEQLIRVIERQPFNDIRICGIFDDRNDARSPAVVAGYLKIGEVSELSEFARIARIDMLLISLPITAERRVLELLKQLWVLPVDIRLPAHSDALKLSRRSYSYIGSLPLHNLVDKPISDWDLVAKRVFDIFWSILGIIAFSPIMLLAAIAIKLDSRGPVFFKQKRHGFNNEVVEVYKFRSMYADRSDPTGCNAVTRSDPRVTRVGAFIRKTSIDELPQFFNVLFGSLSLVGPRPHAIAARTRDLLYTEVVDGYFARHKVKPGVTGWAQINGLRGEMDTEEKIRARAQHDLYYIENWSLLFDLKILLLTPFRLFSTENAY